MENNLCFEPPFSVPPLRAGIGRRRAYFFSKSVFGRIVDSQARKISKEARCPPNVACFDGAWRRPPLLMTMSALRFLSAERSPHLHLTHAAIGVYLFLSKALHLRSSTPLPTPTWEKNVSLTNSISHLMTSIHNGWHCKDKNGIPTIFG